MTQSRIDDPLLKMSEVEELTGLSRRSIYRLIRAGSFPKQYKPGGHSSAWSRNEVLAWRETQRTTQAA